MSQSLTITKTQSDGASGTTVRCHPGEVLREEFMVPLGLSANKVALALRVPSGRITDIVNEKRSISPDTALRLSRYFGTSAALWLNLQSNYDLRLAIASNGPQIEQDVLPLDASHAA